MTTASPLSYDPITARTEQVIRQFHGLADSAQAGTVGRAVSDGYATGVLALWRELALDMGIAADDAIAPRFNPDRARLEALVGRWPA